MKIEIDWYLMEMGWSLMCVECMKERVVACMKTNAFIPGESP